VACLRTEIDVEGHRLTVYSVNTLVIGAGAAGLNAALKLNEQGVRDVLVVTEKHGAGTSFNAGSDKQTYYKLSLAGAQADSPRLMAEDLFHGGCMHGDIALCEALGSAASFLDLVRLGVPFPHDRYGAYVGFRTDNDFRGRATSAGPLTSRLMCERLDEAVADKGIPLLDDHQVVALLKDDDGVCGAVALNLGRLDEPGHGFVLLNARNVVLATGGPGGMYRDSVYPASQIGSTGMALAAGAAAHNLTESQFGLASTKVRWNVSGSYQQVVPTYVSTDGKHEEEFLLPHFPDAAALSRAVFRKGYEWPFDAFKVADHGSSLIDVLVYNEVVKRKRKVFLDYTRKNPVLDGEAREYLEKSGALQERPIDRLQAMNPQAVELYRSKGIDLSRERLRIAVCAQHSNGGLIGNVWWESNVPHLFPVGEVNGTHGVKRPGGSALNAGQVGACRAAIYIARNYAGPPPDPGRAKDQVAKLMRFAESLSGTVEPKEAIKEIRERMSDCGAHIRNKEAVARALPEAWSLHDRLKKEMAGGSLPLAFRALDLSLTHAVYLEAIREYLEKGGKSRGSFLVNGPDGDLADPDDFVSNKILELRVDGTVRKQWVDIRPIPDDDGWFENVWKDYSRGDVFH
jgi:succinate dehydrogenase/fumarate reductase flavoprotein subunit